MNLHKASEQGERFNGSKEKESKSKEEEIIISSLIKLPRKWEFVFFSHYF
ncbi:MAG: hypothetical protein HZA36_02910 [Parcubacteria group bacterium]|nr:hypothetical protein [Parcubacteria group bacterium]